MAAATNEFDLRDLFGRLQQVEEIFYAEALNVHVLSSDGKHIVPVNVYLCVLADDDFYFSMSLSSESTAISSANLGPPPIWVEGLFVKIQFSIYTVLTVA